MTKKKPSQSERRPWRGPSAAREVRRDEQGRAEEQDPRDVAQRGRLPLADQAGHGGVRDRAAPRTPRRTGRTGVRQQATTVTTATASARWPARRSFGDVLDPGEPEHGRRQEEAAVDVRPQDSDRDDQPQPPRVRSAIDDEEQRQREQRHRDELRAERQRRRRDGERAERQPGRALGRRSPGDGTARRSWPQMSPTRAARNSTSPVQPATR